MKIYRPLEGECNEQSANFTGYHAVNAVGWGHDEDLGIDYAIMKNSWGEDWGDGGYFKMALIPGKVGACNMYNLHQSLYDV